MKTMRSDWRTLPWVEFGMIALIAILMAYLLIVAVRLRVDYFDSYQSLLNARTMIHGGHGDYFIARNIFYPILLLPIFLLDNVRGAPLVEFVAAHLLAVLLFGLFLYVSFKLYRLHLARGWALLGALLLSWNLLLISNAPLAKEDIPGALFTTTAFFFYLRARATERWRYFVLAGVMIGAAMGSRYNLAPLLFVVIWSYEIADLIGRRLLSLPPREGGSGWGLLMRVIGLLGLPITLFFLLPVIVFPIIQHSSALGAPAQMVKDILMELKEASRVGLVWHEDAIRNYRFVVESLTWPLVLCAVLGGVASFRSRQRGSLFYLLWFVVFFGTSTYVIGHKEARYLLPALPPLYFFVARGLQAVAEFPLALPRVELMRAARMIAVAGLLVLPARSAIVAAARFTDPVYTSDYEAQVSLYAERLAGDNPIYWVGPSYPLHPRDYVFDLDDPYTYMYHDFAHVAEFWAGRPVYWLNGQVMPSNTDAPVFVFLGPGVGNMLTDGSVLIVNRAPQSYETVNVPPAVPPLVVEQVKTVLYTSTGGSQTFGSAAAPGEVRVARQGPDYVVEGTGLPDGQFELYVGGGSDPPRSVAVATVTGGTLKAGVQSADWPATAADKIVLLYFGLALSFPTSGS